MQGGIFLVWAMKTYKGSRGIAALDYIEMGGELHTLATFPWGRTLLPNEKEAGWVSELVLTFGEEIKISYSCWELNPGV